MNPNTNRIFGLSVVIIIPVVISACGSTEVPLTPVTVQLAWTHQSQFAGMYAADQKGYYADEGLSVTFLEGGFNVDKFGPVLDGTAQFGLGGADELILARPQGAPLKAIATIYRRSPVVFISLADTHITRPQDFVGKTIRSPSNVTPSLRAMMARVGVSPDQYSIVDLPSDLTLFVSGDVPIWGIFINGFAVSLQQAGYELNIIHPDDYGVHFYSDTLFTTDHMIATKPDLVLHFVRATLQGWTWAVENPEGAAVLVQKYKPEADPNIETARMVASLPLVNTGVDYIGWMKPEIWAGMEQTLREQSVLAAPLDVSQVYTMQFLQEIYK